jgi:hypothetical protein
MALQCYFICESTYLSVPAEHQHNNCWPLLVTNNLCGKYAYHVGISTSTAEITDFNNT